jgi:transcriptional regulator with XRE-family HTH domain
MNVNPAPERAISPAVWERREMRLALAARDVTVVYRLLQRTGVSQRRIAALTGQSQSEVSEILKGRQVMAYEVLARIADGIGVPRGYVGLAYDEATAQLIDRAPARPLARDDEREEVRQLLAHAAEVAMGAAVHQLDGWWQPVERMGAPVPERVGLADVRQIEAVTGALRAIDYQHGGGACRDAVAAQARWSQQLLRADCADEVRPRLHLALADLHNLAGWTSFDVGLYTSARRHLARALEQAKHADDPSLVANTLYRMGRLHLHRGWTRDALKFFQLGQIAAQDAGCELTVAMLCANEAWAYALLEDEVQALKSLGRAEDEFARADRNAAPAWVRFFGEADLNASIGMVHAALPGAAPAQYDAAVTAFTRSLAQRGSAMARSRTFELTALATIHLRAGDPDHGAQVGHDAVDLAGQVRSVRTIDRLAPLQQEAEHHRDHAEVGDLADRIAILRAA